MSQAHFPMIDLALSQLPTPNNYPSLAQLKELPSIDGSYEGEFKDNMRHGLGVFIWKNGDAYYGNWQDNQMHGIGLFCYNTGHYVEGVFESNLVGGPACITYPDRSFTKGVFKRGELNGYALFYQSANNTWVLQEYEAGKPKGVRHEGTGKPMSYNFFENIKGIDVTGLVFNRNDTSDAKYKLPVIQMSMAPFYGIGCFELEAWTRHYGIIKNNDIAGLGIRISKNIVEVGKFTNGLLDASGWRLDFGKIFYEGEFIHGKYYGKGVLREWRDRMINSITGIFLNGNVAHKFTEDTISLQALNFVSTVIMTSPKIMQLDVRTYEDAFTKDYTKADHHSEDSKALASTIREISSTKTVSHEFAEYQMLRKNSSPNSVSRDSLQNSPSRRALLETTSHLAKMVNAKNNDPYDISTTLQACQGYIDSLRQKPEEKEPIHRPKRSRSTDRCLEPAFSQVFSISVDDKPVTTHRSVSRDAARHRSNNPSSQVLFEAGKTAAGTGFSSYLNKEKEESEMCTLSGVDSKISQENDSSLLYMKRLSSPALNSWYTHEPSTSGINNMSPLITNEKEGFEFGVRSEAASPLLSYMSKRVEHGLTQKINIEDQQMRLNRAQKNSRSSTNFHSTLDINLSNNPEKVLKAAPYSSVKETSPIRTILNANPAKLARDRSSPALNSSRGTTASNSKLPADKINRPNTPTRNIQVQNSSNKKVVEKRAVAPKAKTPLTKTQGTKDKTPVSASSRPSSPYGKKPAATAGKQEPRKTTRLVRDSPAQVVEVDLYSYSVNPAATTGKIHSEKKLPVGGIITPDKSYNSNNWSTQKPSYMNDEYNTHQSTSTEKYSARSKTPLVSNVVNIDISMFRADTPNVTSELEAQKSSPLKINVGFDKFDPKDHWTNHHSGIKREFAQAPHEQEKKAAALNLNLTNTVHASGDGLHDFAMGTFDGRDKKLIIEEEINSKEDGVNIKHHKFTFGHNVNTPSFSLTGHQNIKFTAGEQEKSSFRTPRKEEAHEQPFISTKPHTKPYLKRSTSDVQSPKKPKVDSPYRIEKQNFSILKTKSPTESPTKAGEISSHNFDSSSFDSSKGYPVKRTCQLKGSCCSGSRGSSIGSPQKTNSQMGSPSKLNRQDTLGSALTTPDKSPEPHYTGSVYQFLDTNILGFPSHMKKDSFRLHREDHSKDDFNIDSQALPTSSNKLEKTHENYLDLPMAQFGIGNDFPKYLNFEGGMNSHNINKYTIMEAEGDATDSSSSQRENFANRTDLKKPKLILESKIPVSHSRSNSREKSPIRKIEISSRRTPSQKTSASKSSAHEGSLKEAQNLYQAHFKIEGNKLNKTPSNSSTSQNHPHAQIHRLPEQIKTVLNPNGHSDMKEYQGKYEGYGIASNMNFKSPKDVERSRSVNKVQRSRHDFLV